jgi:hypothetical protein
MFFFFRFPELPSCEYTAALSNGLTIKLDHQRRHVIFTPHIQTAIEHLPVKKNKSLDVCDISVTKADAGTEH